MTAMIQHRTKIAAAFFGLMVLGSIAALSQPTSTRPNLTMVLSNCSVDKFIVGGGSGSPTACSTALTNGQIIVGQTSSAPLPKTLSGDATLSAAGALTIANDAVTYAKIQNISATQRVLGRNTSGAGDTEEVTATQLLDWIGSTRGSVLYRGASGWTALGPDTSGKVLTTNGAGADPSWAAAGTGTVTSAIIAGGTGVSVSGTCTITTTGTCTVATAITSSTNTLGANVSLSSQNIYVDGPSTAQGTSGTWLAVGGVNVSDTAGNAIIICKLWDGTTVASSGAALVASANGTYRINLSGVVVSPAANIKISCADATSGNGLIVFNGSGNSKDSSLTVVRLQ